MKKKEKKELKISHVDIVFENCEFYTLQPKDIAFCYLDNVSQDIGVNNFQYVDGEVYYNNKCSQLLLGINQNGLKTKSSWDWDGDSLLMNDGSLLEERVKGCDITHIHLFFDDNTNKYISVPWKDKNGNEYVNILQNNLYFENLKGEECMAIIIRETLLTFEELEKEYGI